MRPNAKTRQEILKTLYAAREQRPASDWLAECGLKNAHGSIAFALDVMIETGLVKQSGYKYRITGAGVLACEAAQMGLT